MPFASPLLSAYGLLLHLHMDSLFHRFYTVDKSRNTDKSGNGLGLSIAKTICQDHGGDLTVTYAEGRTTFMAEFPLYQSKKSN